MVATLVAMLTPPILVSRIVMSQCIYLLPADLYEGGGCQDNRDIDPGVARGRRPEMRSEGRRGSRAEVIVEGRIAGAADAAVRGSRRCGSRNRLRDRLGTPHICHARVGAGGANSRLDVRAPVLVRTHTFSFGPLPGEPTS